MIWVMLDYMSWQNDSNENQKLKINICGVEGIINIMNTGLKKKPVSSNLSKTFHQPFRSYEPSKRTFVVKILN